MAGNVSFFKWHGTTFSLINFDYNNQTLTFRPQKSGLTKIYLTNRSHLFVFAFFLWSKKKNRKEIVRNTKVSRTEMVKYKCAN